MTGIFDHITGIDLQILDLIAENFRCEILDVLMPIVTALGDGGVIWIISAALLLALPRPGRKHGIAVALALVCSLLLCNLFLKPVVARIRPYELREGIELIIDKPNDFSFPSGHTSSAFAAAMAMLISRVWKRIWIPAISLAAAIAFSRIYLYVHYPSDVLGGIVVGTLCGLVGAFAAETMYKKWGKSKFFGA